MVPARGGSKGVPLKNIRPLAGLPLIAHTAKTISQCEFIDRAVVSTDHPGMQKLPPIMGWTILNCGLLIWQGIRLETCQSLCMHDIV